MHFNGYDVFYSLHSRLHVSAAIATIFSVMLLLQQYKGTNVVIHVAFTPQQFKIIIIPVKII